MEVFYVSSYEPQSDSDYEHCIYRNAELVHVNEAISMAEPEEVTEIGGQWGQELGRGIQDVVHYRIREDPERMSKMASVLPAKIKMLCESECSRVNFDERDGEMDMYMNLIKDLRHLCEKARRKLKQIIVNRHMLNITTSLDTLFSASYGGNLIWKIDNVDAKYSYAKYPCTSKDPVVCSPPFHFFSQGQVLKMKAKLYLNGVGPATAKFLSLYIEFMDLDLSPSFDKTLPSSVMFCLCDQRPPDVNGVQEALDIVKIINPAEIFNERFSPWRMPQQELMGLDMFGCEEFCSIGVMQDVAFVMNETMKISVFVKQ